LRRATFRGDWLTENVLILIVTMEQTVSSNKMRQIKFRAWDKENKDMYEWDILSQRSNLLEAIEMDKKELWILMQYTGLKDSKGKEIYEGDVLREPHKGFEPRQILEVFWDDEMNSFQSRSIDKQHLYQTPLDNDFEVIGNIYENPELLNE